VKDRIKLNRGGVYGHCSNEYPAKFMENLITDECVLKSAPGVTQDICTNLDFANTS